MVKALFLHQVLEQIHRQALGTFLYHLLVGPRAHAQIHAGTRLLQDRQVAALTLHLDRIPIVGCAVSGGIEFSRRQEDAGNAWTQQVQPPLPSGIVGIIHAKLAIDIIVNIAVRLHAKTGIWSRGNGRGIDIHWGM